MSFYLEGVAVIGLAAWLEGAIGVKAAVVVVANEEGSCRKVSFHFLLRFWDMGLKLEPGLEMVESRLKRSSKMIIHTWSFSATKKNSDLVEF